ncbi:cytochrome P450 [Micromonospora arida]|uniref:cytochrome P450 n=1 Tax=Micromonospora arida TaxID=2203715 RepID=UPI0033C6147A
MPDMLSDLSYHDLFRFPEDFPSGSLFRPPPLLLAVQRARPVCPVRFQNGERMWLISGSDDVRRVMSSSAFSRILAYRGAPRMAGNDLTSIPGAMFNMEGPRHRVLRGVVAPSFSKAAVTGQLSSFEAYSQDAVARLQALSHTPELIHVFAETLVRHLSTELLGLTAAEFAETQSCVRRQSALSGNSQQTADATRQLVRMAARVYERASAGAGGEPILALAAAERSGSISAREAIGTTALLLATGTESLIPLLGTGPLALMAYRDATGSLPEDNSGWFAAADEVLRYYNNGPINFPRVAVEDVIVAGMAVRAKEAVITSTLAAGWDPRKVPSPDRFDITRRTTSSVSFGAGPHFCLGASYVRTVLAVAYRVLFNELPQIRITVPASALPGAQGGFFTRPAYLPVTW